MARGQGRRFLQIVACGAGRVVQIERQESPQAGPGGTPTVDDAVRDHIGLASAETLAVPERLCALFAVDEVEHLRAGMSVDGRGGSRLKKG